MSANRYLNDIFNGITNAMRVVFELQRDFNAVPPGSVALDIAQAKRHLATATAALTMLENETKKVSRP